jgi:hypothetical protein
LWTRRSWSSRPFLLEGKDSALPNPRRITLSEMSYEDAVQALEGAIEQDAGPEPLPTPAPAEQATPSSPPEEELRPEVQPSHWSQMQPRDPATGKFVQPDGSLTDAPAPAQEDTFDGGQFNPDQLPAELQPGWKQLQAAYTQKTQQLAEERKQFDGIDPAQAREAVQLYESLQDPDYLVEFHSSLSAALQARGLTPAQANVAAAQVTEEASTTPQPALNAQLEALRNSDPDLAPVADTLSALEQQNKSLEQRLQSFEDSQRVRQEQERQQMEQMAMAADLQRQEMAIRQSNPSYTDTDQVQPGQLSDMDAIYALSAHFDGNLIHAEQVYRQINESAVGRYLMKKQSVEQIPTVPNAGTTSEIPTIPQDLDEAHRAAEEYLRSAGLETLDL